MRKSNKTLVMLIIAFALISLSASAVASFSQAHVSAASTKASLSLHNFVAKRQQVVHYKDGSASTPGVFPTATGTTSTVTGTTTPVVTATVTGTTTPVVTATVTGTATPVETPVVSTTGGGTPGIR